ncbi:MAG: sugar ABC transporter substrate-binding protein [Acidaminobacter sp.]|uniref:cyclodeaminase/cyclohydrolase family protein n=1 Tax=Acidaminobacter sp. TaxID=1872102 RepID=UPI00137E4E8F|nr:cyclodeaminase/cyclohydrolase family protein [Acidaminobacter sp.]MZQ96665.1 sugar ABC transporter substrate-binding protein [Acidaminobacter sp.]
MLDSSCNVFLDELSSKSPVPGGGGASAYVGAQGMALGMMVGNLTIGKKKYQAFEQDLIELQNKSSLILERLKFLVEEDAKVFLPLSKAYGMAAITDNERKTKDEALQSALIQATLVPLEIARCCCEAIEFHREYAQKGTKLAISDVGVGVIFCMAALQGAKLNVLINTKIMKDQEQKNRIEREVHELAEIGTKSALEIFHQVESELSHS